MLTNFLLYFLHCQLWAIGSFTFTLSTRRLSLTLVVCIVKKASQGDVPSLNFCLKKFQINNVIFGTDLIRKHASTVAGFSSAPGSEA